MTEIFRIIFFKSLEEKVIVDLRFLYYDLLKSIFRHSYLRPKIRNNVTMNAITIDIVDIL